MVAVSHGSTSPKRLVLVHDVVIICKYSEKGTSSVWETGQTFFCACYQQTALRPWRSCRRLLIQLQEKLYQLIHAHWWSYWEIPSPSHPVPRCEYLGCLQNRQSYHLNAIYDNVEIIGSCKQSTTTTFCKKSHGRHMRMHGTDSMDTCAFAYGTPSLSNFLNVFAKLVLLYNKASVYSMLMKPGKSSFAKRGR